MGSSPNLASWWVQVISVVGFISTLLKSREGGTPGALGPEKGSFGQQPQEAKKKTWESLFLFVYFFCLGH